MLAISFLTHNKHGKHVCIMQDSPQNKKNRVVLVKRSKRSCGFVTFFTPHQKKMLKSRVVQHHSKQAWVEPWYHVCIMYPL